MTEKTKTIVIEERKFVIQKFDAKTSLKTARLIIAKVLPVLESFIGSGITPESLSGIDGLLNLDHVVKALNLISDEDVDRLVEVSLRHCFEALPTGQIQVFRLDGTYGVPGVEDDPILLLRLTAEGILWSMGGFFDVGRLGSLLKPLADSFPHPASM